MVLALLGIRDRTPVESEQKYIDQWCEMGLSDELLAKATECSVHTYLEQLWQGFLTTRHGHRLGICSQAPDGEKRLLRGLSSVNVRIARQVHGLGETLPLTEGETFASTLIVGAPGSGKTTLLREVCRELSRSFRVAIADERHEIAACANGQPRFLISLLWPIAPPWNL